MTPRPPRRRQLSERASARLRPRASAALRSPLRRAVASARGCCTRATIDVGLIPSIEYLRGPQPYAHRARTWRLTSRGPVASVALYTRTRAARHPIDRAGHQLADLGRAGHGAAARACSASTPDAVPMAPDLDAMLARADAALIIGDTALFLGSRTAAGVAEDRSGRAVDRDRPGCRSSTPFWAGRPGALDADDVDALQRGARRRASPHSDDVGAALLPDDPARQAIGAALPAG